MSIFLAAMCSAAVLAGGDGMTPDPRVVPPRSVKVLPVFFVPKGAALPTDEESALFMKHLRWTQKRYAELLPGHVTFGIAARKPVVFQGARELGFYKAQIDGGAAEYVGELLPFLGCTQRNCPYVLMMLIMNPVDDYPGGGGQPLNGGFNTGGAMVMMSSAGLTKYPNFQSTMQHELGHSFGLPHVDVYEYDMGSNESLMSYNPRHHTNYLKPSATPGRMIPEDYRALALNQRVFPGLRWDLPTGYKICPLIIGLGAMTIPGQLPAVKVTTLSGEEAGAIMTGAMTPVVPGSTPVFDPGTMWRSGKSADGWATLDVTLPVAVPLSRFVVHTMPPGGAEAARSVRVSASVGGSFVVLASKGLKSMDEVVSVRKTNAQVWRFEFQGSPSGAVVVRGIEFFSGRVQLFPPLVPF